MLGSACSAFFSPHGFSLLWRTAFLLSGMDMERLDSVSSAVTDASDGSDDGDDLEYYQSNNYGDSDDGYSDDGVQEEHDADPESYEFTCLTTEQCQNMLAEQVVEASTRLNVRIVQEGLQLPCKRHTENLANLKRRLNKSKDEG